MRGTIVGPSRRRSFSGLVRCEMVRALLVEGVFAERYRLEAVFRDIALRRRARLVRAVCHLDRAVVDCSLRVGIRRQRECELLRSVAPGHVLRHLQRIAAGKRDGIERVRIAHRVGRVVLFDRTRSGGDSVGGASSVIDNVCVLIANGRRFLGNGIGASRSQRWEVNVFAILHLHRHLSAAGSMEIAGVLTIAILFCLGAADTLRDLIGIEDLGLAVFSDGEPNFTMCRVAHGNGVGEQRVGIGAAVMACILHRLRDIQRALQDVRRRQRRIAIRIGYGKLAVHNHRVRSLGAVLEAAVRGGLLAQRVIMTRVERLTVSLETGGNMDVCLPLVIGVQRHGLAARLPINVEFKRYRCIVGKRGITHPLLRDAHGIRDELYRVGLVVGSRT